jgi:glycosyltransferase involved in cell wall biosynthesis
MPARTVAYLTPLYFDPASCLGGGERYPLNLARGVAAAPGSPLRVEIISFGREPHRQALGPGVDLRVLPLAGRPAHPLDAASWDLPDAVAGASLLHIHQPFTRCGELGLLVARAERIPVCITDHGGDSSPLGREAGLLDLVDRVVAYSDFGASFTPGHPRVSVVKGGVDTDLFRPPADRPPRDRVLFVGRLLPHKGVDALIAAMPPDLPLTVCGQPYNPAYFDRLRALAAGKCVNFVTDADDAAVRSLYARAWATVLPSVHRDCDGNVHQKPELMGFTLLESMACGTPAVASRVGAMPEFVDPGRTGFVYDTPDELTATLRRLAADPGLVEALGREARATVVREYGLAVAGRRLRAVYDAVWAEADARADTGADGRRDPEGRAA